MNNKLDKKNNFLYARFKVNLAYKNIWGKGYEQRKN